MIIVEVFARGAAPRGPPSSDAGIRIEAGSVMFWRRLPALG
jgi:hypothetical protein